MIPAFLLEWAWWAGFIKGLPAWVTAAGVAYLVLMERRRARRLTALEHTSRTLVDGHTRGVDAHRNLAVTLQENTDARH